MGKIKIDKKLKITWRDPSELTPNPRNHRRHTQAQREVLQAALENDGWIDPVIFNRRTGRVIDGHARIEQALADGTPRVPVIELDVHEETERRILARHDRIGALAEIDLEALKANVADLEGCGVSLAELGWASFEMSDVAGSGQGGDSLPQAPSEINYKEQFGVIVLCENESEQEATYERLLAEGYKLKVVTV